jgi:hypothetical protein
VDRFRFWQRFLLAACIGTAGLGLLLAFFDTRVLPGFGAFFARGFWGLDQMPDAVVPYHRFVHGVLGATIAAWATTLAFVVAGPFREREPWAWRAVASSVAIWFAVDSGTSLVHGAWPNVVLNVGSVLPLALPLIFTRSAFARRAPSATTSRPGL